MPKFPSYTDLYTKAASNGYEPIVMEGDGFQLQVEFGRISSDLAWFATTSLIEPGTGDTIDSSEDGMEEYDVHQYVCVRTSSTQYMIVHHVMNPLTKSSGLVLEGAPLSDMSEESMIDWFENNIANIPIEDS